MGEIVKMFVFTFSIFSFFCPSEGRGAMSPSFKVSYYCSDTLPSVKYYSYPTELNLLSAHAPLAVHYAIFNLSRKEQRMRNL